MVTGSDRLLEIEAKLRRGESVNSVSVRSFLGWFGAQRRSHWNVWTIRRALEKAKILTSPDFESAYIDSEIQFELLDNVEVVKVSETPAEPQPEVAAQP